MKPSLPKGTRDFSPVETARRRYIFDTIRKQMELFGYQPLETPAMENIETLTGKYGDEGDRLIFKILNSGEYLNSDKIAIPKTRIIDANKHKEETQGETYPVRYLLRENELSPWIVEKALRYDLTVPFARYVASNRDKLPFPFRRYQMQPVWRADRPQKGRYREFWQCDADVVGSSSLLNEAELIQIYDRVFSLLKLPVIIHLNNRKILAGIAEVAGVPDRLTDITVAIDKLDKIGRELVEKEMLDKGIPQESVLKLAGVFESMAMDANELKLDFLDSFLESSETGKTGLAELRTLLNYFKEPGGLKISGSKLEVNLTLARGLSYYTGTIIEVKARDFAFGSIGGGGRYDDLTGIFGLPGVPGVGISFGADRIYDVLLELNLFPDTAMVVSKLLIANFGPDDERAALNLVDHLRDHGIAAEIYPDAGKLKKQFDYATKKGIPYFCIFGDTERQQKVVIIKELATGVQKTIDLQEVHQFESYFIQ